MTLKGFHEAAPLVKDLQEQEDLLFRLSLGHVSIELSASQSRDLSEIKATINTYSTEEKKSVMDALKAAIESRISRLKKKIEAIK